MKFRLLTNRELYWCTMLQVCVVFSKFGIIPFVMVLFFTAMMYMFNHTGMARPLFTSVRETKTMSFINESPLRQYTFMFIVTCLTGFVILGSPLLSILLSGGTLLAMIGFMADKGDDELEHDGN